MRYFYDCEFIEDGRTIDLISIGVVAEDGREFYAVSSEFDTARVLDNWWLMKNVMPSIEHTVMKAKNFDGKIFKMYMEVTDPALKSREEIKDALLDFVGDDTEPEFWAWYSAYDHVCLAQLFGKMIDLPPHFPMLTMDIKQLHKELKCPEMPKQPEGLHNALADARFNVVRYDYLRGLR